MKNRTYVDLMKKYNRGETNADENALVESWYLHEIVKSAAASTGTDYEKKQQKIFSRVREQIETRKKLWNLWPKSIAAAAVLIGVGVLLRWQVQKAERTNALAFVVKNDIDPGINAATLILENGEKVSLIAGREVQTIQKANVNMDVSNGLLQYEASRAKGGEHTLVTAGGQNYRLKLPDGTLVWLNAASSLKYPASFASAAERKVQLIGEAYFEVAKDKKHPFVVETKLQRIEVLGTHFNISSYSGAPVKTTLVEGLVKVFDKETQLYKELEAGEQGISSQKGLQTQQVDAEMQIAWKDGDFTFQGDDFRSALLKIARWYNVDIIFEDDLSNVMLPGGWISKNSKLSEVLKLMASTAGLRFKIEERRVTIAKK
jgi:ferric-dicitrate binding protein FerR (iron transport regulator)